MRHIRTRRRLKLILTALLAVSAVFFLESTIYSFAPQLKVFTESKIEEAFDRKFKISIGSLDGGVFYPFTLNDCVIKGKEGNSLFPYLEIKNIISDYRIWDLLLRRSSSAGHLLAAKPHIDVKFASKNKMIMGFVRLEGDIDDARVRGYISYLEEERIDFTGRIKNNSFELELKPKDSLLKADGSLSADGLTANLKISHLKLRDHDIVCDAVLKNNFVKEPNDPKSDGLDLVGDLEVKNVLLNYRPFSSLKSSYKISSGVLDIINLELGNDFKISGTVILSVPYNIDIVAIANNTNLNRIFSSLNSQGSEYLSGMMSGRFELKGPIKNLKLSARIEVRSGSLTGLGFDYLSANLKGDGPIIRIEDSRITRESGYFVLAGEIDLSRMGKGSMFEGVKMVTSDTAIIWDGWNTMQLEGIQEVRMKKKMSEELGFGFKKFVPEEKIDESLRETDEYELEYNLNSNESLKFRVGQDQDFFGLEHKNKF